MHKGALIINDKATGAHSLTIRPIQGTLTFDAKLVCNGLRVAVKDERIIFSCTHDTDTGQVAVQEDVPTGKAESESKTESEQQTMIPTGYNVRVLLDELVPNVPLVVESDTGFIIMDLEETKEHLVLPEAQLQILQKGDLVYINGNKLNTTGPLYIVPRTGTVRSKGNSYQGGLLITRHKDRFLLINNLDLEDYVACVLRTESWPGWSLEVNKVLAVVCRGYAIATLKQSKLNKLPYHIKSTNAHQTYKGAHELKILHEAVEQTKGMFLAYDNMPALTMFDSCCGGIVPAKIKGFDFNKAPYLKRNYACTHCRGCKAYTWQAIYSRQGFAERIKKQYPQLKKITHVGHVKKDGAGLVQEVVFYGAKKPSTVTGKKLYSLLQPKVKSRCFTITQRGDDIILNGRGYGHQIGLCQFGANAMVKDKGYSYLEALYFYFPGTTLVRLE